MKKLFLLLLLIPLMGFGQITIENSNNNIKFIESGSTIASVNKSQMTFKTVGAMVQFYWGGSSIYKARYSEIDAPSTANISDLADTLNVWISGTVETQLKFADGTELEQISGKIRTSSVPYTYDIAEGNVDDKFPLFKFGVNQSVGLTEETIWTEGGLYDWDGVDAAPGIVKISSTDANDNAGITQIETATVIGAITTSGNADVIVTSSGMAGSPITLNVAVLGQAQVETQTIVGTIAADGAGDIDVIITGALVAGSPLTIQVAVANDDTDEQVAGKVRTGLGISAITDNYTVSGATTDIILTADAIATNDATLNIAYDNGTASGLTPDATSVNTTTGDAQDDQDAIATKIRAALIANAVIGHPTTGKFTITGATDEIILTANIIAANDATLNVSIDNGTCAGITTAGTSANTRAGVAFGSGAWTCTFYGLSTADSTAINETVSLNGQTAVNSTLSFYRVNRIIINSAGSTRKNEGIVYVGTGTVTTGTPAVKWAAVAIGKNQTLMSVWTIPMGKHFHLIGFKASTDSNKGNDINMYFRPLGELFQIRFPAYLFSTIINYVWQIPLILESGTDIDCRAIGIAAGAGIAITFEGWYEIN